MAYNNALNVGLQMYRPSTYNPIVNEWLNSFEGGDFNIKFSDEMVELFGSGTEVVAPTSTSLYLFRPDYSPNKTNSWGELIDPLTNQAWNRTDNTYKITTTINNAAPSSHVWSDVYLDQPIMVTSKRIYQSSIVMEHYASSRYSSANFLTSSPIDFKSGDHFESYSLGPNMRPKLAVSDNYAVYGKFIKTASWLLDLGQMPINNMSYFFALPPDYDDAKHLLRICVDSVPCNSSPFISGLSFMIKRYPGSAQEFKPSYLPNGYYLCVKYYSSSHGRMGNPPRASTYMWLGNPNPNHNWVYDNDTKRLTDYFYGVPIHVGIRNRIIIP